MGNHRVLMFRHNKNSELVLSVKEEGQCEQTLGICGLVARITKFGKRSNSVKLYALIRRAIEKGCRTVEFSYLPGTTNFGPGNIEQLLLTLFREFLKESGAEIEQDSVEMARLDGRTNLTKLFSYKGKVYRIPYNMDVEQFKRNIGKKKHSSSMKDTGIFPK